MAEVSVLQRINPKDPSGPLLNSPSAPGNWINNQPLDSTRFTNASGFGRLIPPGDSAVEYRDVLRPDQQRLRDQFQQQEENRIRSMDGGSSQKGNDKAEPQEAEPEKTDKESRDRAQGKEKEKEELSKPSKAHKRVKKKNKNHPSKHLGVKDLDQEGGSSGCGGQNSDPASLPNDIVPVLGGLARNISTEIPAMEQLLQNLPNEILGNFIGALPFGLQSFIPPGVIPGLSNTGPFNLNGLIGMMGGAALGNISNDMLRSILPAIGIPQQAIQQLTSMPLAQVLPQLNQIIPQMNQITGGLSGMAMNAASVAQTLSTIQVSLANANNSGIPLNPQMLNQAVGLAIQSTGLGQIIPTNIMGLANSFVQNPMGTLINSVMGGGGGVFPILPSNLSNPSAMLLSGLSQFVPAQLAQTLMNPAQLMNMLPMNLQNLIPAVAPILQGAAPNLIQQIANASPEKVPGSDQAGGNTGGGGCKIKEAPNDGKNSKDVRDISYSQMLSPVFDLFQLSAGSTVNPGSNRINKGDGGKEVDEVIKNLSSVAVNVLEPLREAFPFMQIISGYRETGEHADGKSVDVAWPYSPQKLMEIADWARQNLPVTVQMNQYKKGWLHLKFEESCKGGAASTSSAGGCEQGLVNRKG